MDTKNTVLLFSGGLDSSTLLGMLLAEGHKVLCVSFRYGSLHQHAETNAAARIAVFYKTVRKVFDISPSIFFGGKSALLGQSEMPNAEYEKEGPSSTVVPFRNAIMLAQAVGTAESLGYNSVAIANHANDFSHWAYPDCSPEFMGAFTSAVYAGTLGKVRLIAPFQWMTKKAVVQKAFELQVPVYLTWSCYEGNHIHCGKCPTCLERIAAFMDAGFIDPVMYKVAIKWPSNCVHFTED